MAASVFIPFLHNSCLLEHLYPNHTLILLLLHFMIPLRDSSPIIPICIQELVPLLVQYPNAVATK